jgi:hypothetical protein
VTIGAELTHLHISVSIALAPRSRVIFYVSLTGCLHDRLWTEY